MAEKITLALWYVLTALLAVSTFCAWQPTDYGSWWFVAVWAAVSIAIIVAMGSGLLRHNTPAEILHGAMLLIIAGGAATWLWGDTGTICLAPGKTTDSYISDNSLVPVELGATVELDSFVIERHAGIESPRDFISHLKIDGRSETLSVNKPISINGTRLFQASYLDDGTSVIKVNNDRWGMWLSYAGYILLGIGWLLVMLSPKGSFRRILRTLGVAAMLLTSTECPAINGISRDEAAKMRTTPVLYQGRITPLNTPATEIVRKLTGQNCFGDASAEQIVGSMMLYPEEWMQVKLIQVKDKRLRELLGAKGEYVSVKDLFDSDGNYRLKEFYSGGEQGLDRAILELDEKTELFANTSEGKMFRLQPEAELSPVRLYAELANNNIPFAKLFFMAMLSIAVLMLLLPRPEIRRVLTVIAIAAVAWQICGYAIRWTVAGRVPLGTGGETLQFVSILLGIIGIVSAAKTNRTIGALTLLMSGFTGLVAWLAMRSPAVTPLMPVLSSPWLAVHVSLVMTSYALLTFTAATSVAGVMKPKAVYRSLCMAVLYPALFLLSAGIFTGAVWANESWGRYWAWDPKETWALITLMVYAVPLHKSARFINNKPRTLYVYLLIAFLTVVMTYYGVNYLQSLHAYQ
ncbi:MAG: cytochrome c biogenesis protein CcsA [Muribaculaceae bacterium]|nr:cytochrome c biogenesis protein CcsA [Muribaculaceae bacterium]